MIARRTLLRGASVAFVATTTARHFISASCAQSKASVALLARVDHLLYATPDLNLGIDTIEKLTGVRATPGGQHPGLGTRNALLALGPSSYLEILGPDPEQPKPERPRAFNLDDLEAPRLATWAAKGTNLDQLVSDAATHGVKLGAVIPGSRKRPDGVVLSWRFTTPSPVVADGIVPFFVDWGQTPHPSSTAAQGLTLIDLRAEHPDPQAVQKMLNQLGLDLRVQAGSKHALIATITGPRGDVELR
jgi:hypothetical protein